MVEEAGKIKITINMTDFRYSVKDNSAPTELYMTGSAYNWGKIWKQFVPVNDTKGAFWGIYYFAADDQVKLLRKPTGAMTSVLPPLFRKHLSTVPDCRILTETSKWVKQAGIWSMYQSSVITGW